MTQYSFDFVAQDKKSCAKCSETKGLSDFYKHPYTKDGLFSVCKICYSNRENLKNRLKAGFMSLKTTHCECCGIVDPNIQLDHCHETGNFRGFICRSCNKTLGVNGDTYDSILSSDLDVIYIDYMKQANKRMGK